MPQKSEVYYPPVHGYAVSRSTGHLASRDKWQLNLGLNIVSRLPSGCLEPEPEFRKRPNHHLTSIHRRPTTSIRNVDVPQRSIGCAPIGLTVLHRLDVKVGLELCATVRYGSAGFADERRPAGINGEDGVVRVRNSHDEGSGRCRGQALYWQRLPPSQRKFIFVQSASHELTRSRPRTACRSTTPTCGTRARSTRSRSRCVKREDETTRDV